MWKDDLEGLMMLLDGVLTREQEALLRARLEDEPELAQQWNQLKALQGILQTEFATEISPDFTDRVMKEVHQTDQVPPSLWSRLFDFLSHPIAIPITATALVAILWLTGLPQSIDPSVQQQSPATAIPYAPETSMLGETEIESIDNPTNYNVLVLAAPGSPNRMIWISQRMTNDEG